MEYVFQVYGVFTINNMEWSMRVRDHLHAVTVMITMATTSSTPSLIGFTSLVVGVSVLSIIVIILLVVIIFYS